MSEELLNRLRDARQQENLLEVSRAARTVLEAGPDLGSGWTEVASLCMEAGDDKAALHAAKKLAEHAPQHVESWLWVTAALISMGEFELALKTLESQIARQPNSGVLQRRTGRVLLELGRTSGAELSFRRAAALDPGDALAWEGLSQSRVFASGDDDLVRMEEARLNASEAGAGNEQRGILSYAIAKAYEDVGEFDVAARRVSEGAAFFREGAPFDLDQHEAGVAQLLATYDERFASTQEEAGVVDSRPVFILAPPAAGASWLARVLSADENAARLERGNALFWMSASPLGDQRPEDIARALAEGGDSNVLAQVGRAYLDFAEERAGRSARRIIDPTSLSEMAAGAAGLALPAAKFIRITRDPGDLAWAIYKRRFRKGRNWSYHPDDIARVLAAHNRLCEQWELLFPGRIQTVRYEDLAADAASEVRRLAAFAGVDEDAALAEAWLRPELFRVDPPGIRERAGSRFEAVEAALSRAGLTG